MMVWLDSAVILAIPVAEHDGCGEQVGVCVMVAMAAGLAVCIDGVWMCGCQCEWHADWDGDGVGPGC